MSVDFDQVRYVICKSMEESRGDGYSEEFCRQRATFHALKALYLLLKDVPRDPSIRIIGVEEGSRLRDVIEVTVQPFYLDAMRAIPGMVKSVSDQHSGGGLVDE